MKKWIRIIPLLLLGFFFTTTAVRPVEAKCMSCAHKRARAKARKRARARARKALAKAKRAQSPRTSRKAAQAAATNAGDNN